MQNLNEYTTPATDDQFSKFRITDNIPSDGNGGCKYIMIELCKNSKFILLEGSLIFTLFYLLNYRQVHVIVNVAIVKI